MALSTSADPGGAPQPTTQGSTRPGYCDRGQGTAAPVPPFPTTHGTTQACTQGRGGHCTRAGRLPLGRAPTGAGGDELTRRWELHVMTRLSDGPRRRRMIRGTIVRIGGPTM